MNVIYLATNKLNGKQYVGQTRRGITRRKSEHVNSAGKTAYGFPRAIAKYGASAFEWDVLCTVSDHEADQGMLDEFEELTIEMYSTLAPGGYNVFSGNPNVEGCRRVKKPRRREEDKDLPLYISSAVRNGRVEGYQVHHPSSGRSRVFGGTRGSMEEKLAMAESWLEDMNKGVICQKPKKARTRPEDDALPVGVYYTIGDKQGKHREGYLVQSRSGVKGKDFCSSKMTLEEKRAAALSYVAGNLEVLPKYVSRLNRVKRGRVCEGYAVRCPGVVGKEFCSNLLSMPAKLAAAVSYLAASQPEPQ